MRKVLLCIPPDYDYKYPPLGTPALTAFLKHKGVPVEQLDLNLRYRDFLIDHIHSPSLSREEKKIFLSSILEKFFKENLKNRYYSKFLPRDNEGTFPYLPYDNNTNSSFYFTERLLSSEYLWRYLEDTHENTFCQFYNKQDILRYLKKEKIYLLGISIISPSQVIAGLTLGLLVKRYMPHIHVNIGGQWPTLYRKVLLERKDLFKCFDSIIVFEGETPLYGLAKALKEKRNISLSNVILKGTKSDFSNNHSEENLDFLPCPDFDGLPLEDYDNNQLMGITITYETSRGCYWGKCAYCVDLPLPRPSYRRKNPKLVARDIEKLTKRYKAKVMMLGDPGLSPLQMLEVSKEMSRKKIDIDWWTMARLDRGFNQEIFKIASRAGLKQVNFGFESASDRICNLFDKGNKVEQSARIIKQCSAASINVALQVMLGLPKETYADVLETINFLIANNKFISDIAFNVYYLTPANLIYTDPEKYGIKYSRDTSLPFKFFTPFNNLYGMSKKEARLLEQLYYSLLEKINARDKEKYNGSITDTWLNLRLNGESSRMNVFKNKKDG